MENTIPTIEDKRKWTAEVMDTPNPIDRKKWTADVINEELVRNRVTNKVAMVSEPDVGFVDNIVKFLNDFEYNMIDDTETVNQLAKKEGEAQHFDEGSRGLIKGSAKAITSTAKFGAELTGSLDTKDYLDDADAYLDKVLETSTAIGSVGETAGRLATGFFLTGGTGVATIPARMAQGFAIDLFAFEGKSGNIADIFAEHDVDMGGIVEALRTDMSDGELTSRFKNAIGGALVGGALESTIAGFKFAKNVIASNNIVLKADDSEAMGQTIQIIKDEVNSINASKVKVDETVPTKPELTEVDFNHGKYLLDKATEMIKDVPENYDDLVKQGEQVVKQSEQVDATVNLKQPLNAEKIAPSNAETLAKATQDIKGVDYQSHKELLYRANKDLENKLSKEDFDLVKDLSHTAESTKDLSLKVTQARLVVANLADKYNLALNVAKKEGGAEAHVRAFVALDNLYMVSKILKEVGGNTAQALSAFKLNAENANLFDSLKLMDNIGTDYSMSMLRQAMKDGNMEDAYKLMENLSDLTSKTKDHLDNYKDGFFTKLGNILSEHNIASMLSSPSTLAVNIIGNSYVKHQRLLQDSLQFLYGQITRSPDRMKAREFNYLLRANIIPNGKTVSIIGKNIQNWAKSGFKDEVIDDAILARYVQDQDHQHKYISSQYMFGKDKGNMNTLFNNVINTYGKLARSPYKVIGVIDDYYKREAFRSELVRVGSRLADVRKIPDAQYDEFIDKFIKVNTELHMLRNSGHKPTAQWVKQNQKFIGNREGEGLFKYADEARDHANYMTFQTELKGVTGNIVDALNSNGFLRLLIPFKTTPINMLKMTYNTTMDAFRSSIRKDIMEGGVKGNIALAKMTYSTSLLTSLGYLISSGTITGSHPKESREVLVAGGIPEYSVKVGDKWYEYKQLEPIATILGVMTDIASIQRGAMIRKDELMSDPKFQDFAEEIGTVISDLGMSIVNNITSKTYAKSLADLMEAFSGEGNIVNYTGNLLSSTVPMSSLANYVGREFGDGYKKESSEFTEKILSKYRVFLERDALDVFGRKVDEIEYTPFLTKYSNVNAEKNVGIREVIRLGINVHKMSKVLNFENIPVELDAEQYNRMRRSLDTEFKLADRINEIVTSDSYKNMSSDYAKKELLTSVINKVKEGATALTLRDSGVSDKLKEGVQKLSTEFKAPPKETYNSLIIKDIEKDMVK